MILWAGVETVVKAVADLTDRQTADTLAMVDAIKRVGASLTSRDAAGGEIRNLHDVRLRRMGASCVADLHVAVDPTLSVTASYQAGEKLRQAVLEQVPELTELFVHIDAGEHAFGGPPKEEFAQHDDDAGRQPAPPPQHRVEAAARRVVAELTASEPLLVGVSHVSVHYVVRPARPKQREQATTLVMMEVNLVFVPPSAMHDVLFAEVHRVAQATRRALLQNVEGVDAVDVHVEMSRDGDDEEVDEAVRQVMEGTSGKGQGGDAAS
jgi:hypothetical protein